jgi:hypothetical protein
MSDPLHLSTGLASIQSRAKLISDIKKALQEAFGDQLPTLRGNVELVREILISERSMAYPMKSIEEEDQLFLDIYTAVFGAVQQNSIERTMLMSIVSHLRETGSVYRRSRFGNFVRAILHIFRA